MASTPCTHSELTFVPSAHAKPSRYRRPTAAQRIAACSLQKPLRSNPKPKRTKTSSSWDITEKDFPAPLILPRDDLAYDPEYPTQDAHEWLHEEERNKVTRKKNVVYVAVPPSASPEADFMRTWSQPKIKGKVQNIPLPTAQDVIDYLGAFYFGVKVKELRRPKLSFTTWDSSSPKTNASKNKVPESLRYIGLSDGKECVRIQTRPSRDGIFEHQLSLNDLLDCAMGILPKDAYALLLLVQQDLFEDDDDDFACGRAYGGSRVAVVSTARYHPMLDEMQDGERIHAWPASHCKQYVEAMCEAGEGKPRKTKANAPKRGQAEPKSLAKPSSVVDSNAMKQGPLPIEAAVQAHNALPPLGIGASPEALSGLWLSRVCRTASHELGHCFGIDHCVYYACVMQGTGSIAEDYRQPPYLCPVDLTKTLDATGAVPEARYGALLSFCSMHNNIHMFAAFEAWLRARLTSFGIGITSE